MGEGVVFELRLGGVRLARLSQSLDNGVAYISGKVHRWLRLIDHGETGHSRSTGR